MTKIALSLGPWGAATVLGGPGLPSLRTHKSREGRGKALKAQDGEEPAQVPLTRGGV